MNDDNTLGQIITLYSFKGGVGRTMAVANIAFLAALNGRRVLVMDWDLEAPGLAYYFRGLLDPANAKVLRDSPGIMDFVWDWSSSIRAAKNNDDINNLTERFQTGRVFSEAVCSIIEDKYLDKGGCLDFIGAGRRWIGGDQSVAYEDALAKFSWNSFFSDEAGGYPLENLKRWAKTNYDLILIDSRTGLADVAGICTMQLPDAVAMCFILNRQNIDGIAKVSAAVRIKRTNEVRLHAIPMRVSRSENPEESDAKARATTELSRIGGFSAESLNDDFKTMSVAAADNVPFYESLAPFYATDPSLDPLTLNYLRLANRLLTQQLEIPFFDPELMETAIRRLAPRNATVEYLTKLRSAEPARAASELRRLLDSALDTEVNGGELIDDYVTLLVDVTFAIGETNEEYSESLDLQTRSLDLVRAILPANPDKWSVLLATLVQRHLDSFSGVLEPEEEHQLEEELDTLLAARPTVANQLKRIGYKRTVARRCLNLGDVEAAKQIVGEYLVLARDLVKSKSRLSPDELDETLAAEVDATLIFGDTFSRSGHLERALREYMSGLERLRSLDANSARSELTRLRHDLHFRIAGLLNGMGNQKEAGLHAIAALNWGQNQTHVAVRFMDLASVILGIAENEPELVLEFCNVLVSGTEAKKFHLATYNSRVTRSAVQFLGVILSLCQVISRSYSDQKRKVIRGLVEIAELVASTLVRRRRTIGERHNQELGLIIDNLFEVLRLVNEDADTFGALNELHKIAKPRRTKDVK